MVRRYVGSDSGAAIHRWPDGERPFAVRRWSLRSRHRPAADGVPSQHRALGRPAGLPGRPAARYDRPVTDRGPADAPLACPFLAFEDDRDGRSPRPDHRHRCYAEVRPAPRAIAHQERYCLTAAFASCPTFLDWARREAAAVREPTGEGASPIGEWATPAAGRGVVEAGASVWSAEEDAGVEDRPRRDWAAPPPWSAQPGPERPGAPMPPFLAGREGGGEGAEGRTGRRGSVEPEDAGAGWPGVGRRDSVDDEAEGPVVTVIDPARRTRTLDHGGVPPWEHRRRSEAYPRLRTRMGLPTLPPLLLAAAAVVVAALALFFLPPMLLNLGGEAPASPSPSPSLASPSIAPSPTATPAPTPLVYTVKAGDTLSKIAKQFGVSLDALIEANKATITNPDRINIGDQIIIPTPPPDVIPGEPSPEASEAVPSESP